VVGAALGGVLLLLVLSGVGIWLARQRGYCGGDLAKRRVGEGGKALDGDDEAASHVAKKRQTREVSMDLVSPAAPLAAAAIHAHAAAAANENAAAQAATHTAAASATHARKAPSAQNLAARKAAAVAAANQKVNPGAEINAKVAPTLVPAAPVLVADDEAAAAAQAPTPAASAELTEEGAKAARKATSAQKLAARKAAAVATANRKANPETGKGDLDRGGWGDNVAAPLGYSRHAESVADKQRSNSSSSSSSDRSGRSSACGGVRSGGASAQKPRAPSPQVVTPGRGTAAGAAAGEKVLGHGKLGRHGGMKPAPIGSSTTAVQWLGFGYIQSDCGTVLAMNFESDHAPLPVRAMALDTDGVPVKGMLWRMNPDGSLQNKATGLVLQISYHKSARKVLVCCDHHVPGDGSQQWYATADREIFCGANHYMLTIRNGSMKDRGEVWCNNKKFWQGVTKAQRWTFVPYAGQPKMPTYKIHEKHRAILEGATVF
jgi:hypothetical protein